MTPTTLRMVGEALYGRRWQRPLAGDLGIPDRTVRRWVAGDSKIPARVSDQCLALLRRRRATVARAEAALYAERALAVGA
jgi:hypothetical protein